MARCGCTAGGCSCVIHGSLTGDCVTTTVTGAGTFENPFIIEADIEIDPNPENSLVCNGAGLFAQAISIDSEDSDCINMSVNGDGTIGDPWIIQAQPNIDNSSPNNLLQCNEDGLSAVIALEVSDTNCIDMGLSGFGTEADPFVIDAQPIISAIGDNVLTCEADGLYVPAAGADVHDGAGSGSTITTLTASSPTAAGTNAVGIGLSAAAASNGSIALGSFAVIAAATQGIAIGGGVNATAGPSATAQGAIAIGASNAAGVTGARASGVDSIAIGSGDASIAGALASGLGSIAIGILSISNASSTTAVGAVSEATAANATAIGISAEAHETGSVSIGASSEVQVGATDGVAIGQGSIVQDVFGVALGSGSTAGGVDSVALGLNSQVNGDDSVGVGPTTTASHNNAVAIGDNVSTTNDDQFNAGDKTMIHGCPSAAPADADLINNQVTFWVNEGGSLLNFKVKNSAGVVKSGTVAIV